MSTYHTDAWKGLVMWKRFWFESNQFFDNINGPEDWIRLRSAYPRMSNDDLLNCKEATYKGARSLETRNKRPNYGMRIEHDGDRTLRDFFVENGMLDSLPVDTH